MVEIQPTSRILAFLTLPTLWIVIQGLGINKNEKNDDDKFMPKIV